MPTRPEAKNRQLPAVLECTHAVSSPASLDEILSQVVRAAAIALGCELCALLQMDDDSDSGAPRVIAVYPGSEESSGRYPDLLGRLPTTWGGVLGVLESLQPFAACSQEADESLLALPVLADAGPLGVLLVIDRSERRFSHDDIELARAFSEQAALAIRHERLQRALQLRETELDSFMEASRALTTRAPLKEILSILTRRASEALDCPECMVYEYDESREAIIPRGIFEREPSGWDGLGEIYYLSDHPAEAAFLQRSEPLLERISDPSLDPASRETMEKWGEKTCLSIPARGGGETKGLLVFYDMYRERTFDKEEMTLAYAFAALTGRAIHVDQLLRWTEERNARLAALLEASRSMGASLDPAEVIEVVASHVKDALAADECIVLRGDAGADDTEETTEGPLAEYGLAEHHQDDRPLRPVAKAEIETPDEFARLTIALPLGSTELAKMVVSRTESDRRFTRGDVELAQQLADQAQLAIHNAQLYQDLRNMHVASLRVLVAALSAKEPYTRNHAARVGSYVILLGRELGWPDGWLQRADEACWLHDIGKLAVSDRILLKPGPLSEREWEIMREHPVLSAEIVRPMVDQDLALAIRHHHERCDGSGYPDGLAGQAIPAMARAMCIADSYDAMSFQRPYSPALSYTQCRAELGRGRGSQFDPDMVDAFLSVLDSMQRRKAECLRVAGQAAALIDGDKHKKLCRPEDENSPEYREIAATLRSVLDASEGIRFLTTQAFEGSTLVMVVDPEEDERFKSRLGEPLTPDEEMQHIFGGTVPDMNVLFADEWGVWVTASAPVRDSAGEIVALVGADSPADPEGNPARLMSAPIDLSSVLSEATRRIARAELDATTDGLTALCNHRYFHEYLSSEVTRSATHGSSFAVVFIDIDHFKGFNDRWGHPTGDAALRAVARVIERCVRRIDVVARYGGEEFAVILAEADLGHAYVVAERIRREIAESTLVFGTDRLTASIGVAVFPSDAASKSELVERADSAMYLAKRRGRNQVATCSSEQLTSLTAGAAGLR